MTRLRITGITLSLGEGAEALKGKVASILHIPDELVSSLAVVRKSIDARRRKPPRFIYALDCTVPDGIALTDKEGVKIEVLQEDKKPLLLSGKDKDIQETGHCWMWARGYLRSPDPSREGNSCTPSR